MKRIHIILVVLIGIAIAAIVSTYGDASTYESFSVAAEHEGKEFHVVGTLDREKEKYYDPKKDPNYFTFYLRDEKGEERKVIYHSPEPQDFESSEKIVIIGKMQGEEFIASQILLKCPSKYNETEVKPG